MENFYSRCLLCTCTSDVVTPHLYIFSEAGNQLHLSEKINKYLNIQIVVDLPQNVCRSCMEKLEVTHELMTSSQQARVTLLQIKQQIENFGVEVKQEISDCSELDCYQPTTDSTANHNKNYMDIRTNEIPIANPNRSSEEFDQSNSALHSTKTLENTAPFEEVFISEERAIKQEPGEDQMECSSRNDAMESSLEMRLGVEVPKFLKCDTCSFYTFSKTRLVAHMQTHQTPANTSDTRSNNPSNDTGENIPFVNYLKCEECGMKYVHPEMLQWHIDHCHSDRAVVRIIKVDYRHHDFQCLLCKMMCKSFLMMIKHLRSQHQFTNLPFHCNMCSKSFISAVICKKHKSNCCGKYSTIVSSMELSNENACSSQNIDYDVDELKCNLCNIDFNSIYGLKKHNSIYHPRRKRGGMQFKCGHCNDSYTTFPRLKAHCVSKHPGKYIIQCDVCKTEFASKMGYTDHMKYAHHTQGFSCSICFATFSRPNNLKAHIRNVHSSTSQKEPLSCNICKATFKCQQNLRIHILNMHGAPVVIHCKYCSYSTLKRGHLTNHINTKHLLHTQQSFACNLCTAKFNFKTHLERHIRSVHTSKIMHCEFCQYNTCRKTGLIKHFKFKHFLY